MKKKVLFSCTVLRGHLLVFHLPYMRWFQEQGYEVHVCARNDTHEPSPDIPYCDVYHELPFERSPFSAKNINVYKQLKAIINREDFALIHCHTPVGGLLTRLAARKARKRGTRVFYTAHGFHFFTGAPLRNWLLFYPAERIASRWTDTLITINQEDYARAQRFHAKQAALVPGVGVDLARFADAAPADRAGLGIPENVPLLLTVGELTPRKNDAVTLRAMARMRHAEAHLALCGVGEMWQELERLARSLDIANRVHFLGFCKDVPGVLHAADVFVFPSLHEGLPVSLMEAMASGLPCAVSRVRGNADLIAQDEGGLLCAPTDAEALARNLDALLDDPDLCRHMGEHNQQVVRAYSLENALQATTALYAAALKEE